MTSKPNKIFLIVLFLCANLSTVLGQQIYHVSPNGSETADGLTWANEVSLERALDLVENGDEVWMKEGNYVVSETYIVYTSITILGGFDGTETSADQRDWENNVVNLDGNNNKRIMKVYGNEVVIDGITFKRGYTNSYGGAAINSDSYISSLYIINCTFFNNHADMTLDRGGAIYLRYIENSQVNNCEFYENSAGSHGGAILSWDNDSFEITDCEFRENSAGSDGGAIYSSRTDSLEITDCEFRENSAEIRGGAIYIWNSDSLEFTDCEYYENSAEGSGGAMNISGIVSLEITDCIFNNNSSGGDGGAIDNTSIFNGEINFSEFSNNSSDRDGGAIYYFEANNLEINSSEFSNNFADKDAGAIYFRSFNNLKINSSEFSNNSANDKGGAINIWQGVALNPVGIKINSSEFSNNSAIEGGGIYIRTDHNVEFSNLVFKINSATEGGAIYSKNNLNITNSTFFNNAGTAIIQTQYGIENKIYNSIFYGNTPTSSFSTAHPDIECNIDWYNFNSTELIMKKNILQVTPNDGFSQNNIIGVDPLFVNPAADDFSLTANSPAIDVGGNSLYQQITGVSANSDTDIIGNDRVFNTIIDMGAYELQEEPIYLDCTNLTLPTDAQTEVAIDTNISWSAVSDATGYTLQIGTSSGASDILNQDVGNVTTYDLPTDLGYDTTYYVTIIPYNDQTTAVDCTEYTFTTEEWIVPDCSSITLPTDGQTDVAIDTNISWSAVSDATGYTLQIGTSSGASDILNQNVGNVTTYDLPTDLDYDTTYYVNIIPYNDQITAVNCTEYTFTTTEESIVLDCSSITLPTDGQIGVAIDTNISWNAVNNATGYTLQIGTSSGASDILNQEVGNVTTYDLPTDLDYGTTYYVTIIPYNDQTTAVNCTEYTFTTTEESIVLDCSSITLPTDGQTDVAIDTTISWNAVSNATGYTLQIGTSSGASDILNQDVGNVTTYDLPTDLDYGTTYYVNIIPYNDQTTAVNCTEYTFTTAEESIVLDCTSITLPTDGQTEVAIDTNISWSAVNNATGYTLQIGTSSGASDILNQEVGNVTNYDLPTDLDYGTTYYVNIIPYNDQTTAVSCSEFSFTIEEINIAPYNVITPNGDGLNDVIDYSFLLEYENVFMQIYDRYGKIVFEGNQANNYIWDGLYFGRPLPTGTYWMVLQWTLNGKIKEKQRYLMLKNYH